MKAALIVDGNYLSSYSVNRNVDMIRLKQVLEKHCGQKFSESHYVCTKSVSAVPYLRFLRQAEPHGPRMRVHEHEKRSSNIICNHCGEDFTIDIAGGVDVHISVLAMKMLMNESADHIVLVAGSGNLEPLVTHLMDQGIDITVCGDERTVSTLLQPYVTDLLWLDDLDVHTI